MNWFDQNFWSCIVRICSMLWAVSGTPERHQYFPACSVYQKQGTRRQSRSQKVLAGYCILCIRSFRQSDIQHLIIKAIFAGTFFWERILGKCPFHILIFVLKDVLINANISITYKASGFCAEFYEIKSLSGRITLRRKGKMCRKKCIWNKFAANINISEIKRIGSKNIPEAA